MPIQGAAKPGISTGQALDAMEQIASKNLPEGFAYDWTEIAFQQKAAGGTAIEDPPGERNGPFGTLVLAYLRDPSGNKICAVHRPG